MKPPAHIAASTAVSTFLWFTTKSPALTLGSFGAGFLVDLDHIFDYVREYGIRLNIPQFFHTFRENLYHRMFLVLHAWEWLVVLVAVSVLCGGNGWLLGISIGYAHHLVLDQISNPVDSRGYFLTWRAARGCEVKRIVTRGKWRKKERC